MAEQDAPPDQQETRPRTGFGPVVLAGLASAVLAAVAGTRAWVEGTSGQLSTETAGDAALVGSAVADGIGEMPLAGALSLVVLAGWGVVLVTRGRFRRTVMVVAALAAVGLLVTTVWALFTLQDSVADQLTTASGADTADGPPHRLVRRRAASPPSAACSPRCSPYASCRPGRRWDAATTLPTGRPHRPSREGNLEIWKALDEGHDPTDRQRPLD